MPVDPSLTISIDRTSLSLPPLVCSGKRDGSDFFITDYAEPAIQARVSYLPDSDYVDGSVPRSSSVQQTILPFTVFANADTETAARAAIKELRDAVAFRRDLGFDVTVTVSDADPEVWTCNPGSVTPTGSRTLTNLKHLADEWSVSLPCYPVRG